MEKINAKQEGFEPQETITINGHEYMLIKKEQPKELTDVEKLHMLRKKLNKFAADRNFSYLLNGCGDVSLSTEFITFNHNTETVIRAERMWIMWRRLAEMLNGSETGNYYIYYYSDKAEMENQFNNKIEIADYSHPDGTIRFKDENTAQKAIELFGENNVVWMLKNL
jgi:hypothetical protein